MGITKRFYNSCKEKEFGSFLKLVLHADHSKMAVYLIRNVQLHSDKKNFFSRLLCRNFSNKLVKDYGIFVHPETIIGLGLKLPHPNGIIIGKAVKIGENVTIYQQVTIGSSNVGDWRLNKQPIINSGVTIFAGAKIIGDISIAEDTTIGANSVVTKSIIEKGTYAGVPAKMIKKTDHSD